MLFEAETIASMPEHREAEKKKETLKRNITVPHFERHKELYDRLTQVDEIDAAADIRKLMQERIEYLASRYLDNSAA